MIWIALLVTGLSALLIKFGAMSVWVSVLSLLLKLALVIIAGAGAFFLGKLALNRSKNQRVLNNRIDPNTP